MDEQPKEIEYYINIVLTKDGPKYQTNMNELMLPSLFKLLVVESEKKLGIK